MRFDHPKMAREPHSPTWMCFPAVSPRSVRSYSDFVQYLKEKHPRIRAGKLDFEGKNDVLWWVPESVDGGGGGGGGHGDGDGGDHDGDSSA